MAIDTTVLDDFERADENPVSQGGKWIGHIGSNLDLKTVGGVLANTEPTNFVFASGIYNELHTDGSFWVTPSSNRNGLQALWVRYYATSGGANGYFLNIANGNWEVYRADNGPLTKLGATIVQALTSGDSVGIAVTGSTIEVWYKPVAGAWTMLDTRTDTNHTSGVYALQTNNPTIRWSEVGGKPAPMALSQQSFRFRTDPTDDLNEVFGTPAGIGFFRIAIGSFAPQNPSFIRNEDDYVMTHWFKPAVLDPAHAQGIPVIMYLNSTRCGDGLSHGVSEAEARALGAIVTEHWDTDANGFVARPDVPGYKELWASHAIAHAAECGAVGVMIDDVNTEADGDTSSAAIWRPAMETFNAYVGPALKAAGLIGLPNLGGAFAQRNQQSGGWLENQIQYYDGYLEEFFINWQPGLQFYSLYNESLKVHSRQAAQGKIILAGSPSKNNYEPAIKFAISVALLATEGGTFFFSAENADYDEEQWFSCYDDAIALGAPINTKYAHGFSDITNLAVGTRGKSIVPFTAQGTPTLFEGVILNAVGDAHPDPSADLNALSVSTAFHMTTDADDEGESQSFAVESGKTYRVSMFVNIKNRTALGVRPVVHDAGGTFKAGYSTGAYIATNIWERIDFSFTADATATWTLRMLQQGAGTLEVYWTAVLIDQSTLLRRFGDGDITKWEWLGTANESTSRRKPNGEDQYRRDFEHGYVTADLRQEEGKLVVV